MSLPWSFEDRVEVPISSPEKAQYVAEGIEHWLGVYNATEVRWNGALLRCSPLRPALLFLNPYDPYWRKPLRYVADSEFEFKNRPEKVTIRFAIRYDGYRVSIRFLANDLKFALRIAASRGLTAGAERELNALRSR